MNKILVSDSHTDLLTSLVDNVQKLKKEKSYFETTDFSKTRTKVFDYLLSQNVDILSLAVFTHNKNMQFKDLCLFKQIVEEYNQLEWGRALLSIEDIGFIKHFYGLQELVKLNPFSCTLTWNYNNRFCGGVLGKSGLTEFGKFAVRYLEENNILIDTAHMNRKSFWEFVDLTKKPIFNSHSNIFSIHKNKRNLLDNQIKKIVETNGFMGITLYDKFIKNGFINSFDIALQFNYLVEKFGINNFSFGTDFFGVDETNLPTDIKSYNDLYLVADHLCNFGYSSHDIKKLMNKNFSDFVSRVQG